MKRPNVLFWLGSAMYVTSFFLVAANGAGSSPQHPNPMRGYSCAWGALVAPWAFTRLWPQGAMPILMPALALSGWINLVLVGTVLTLWKRRRRAFSFLRVTSLLMLPSCWVVFYFGIHPREGYVIWTIGMLLVLFSPNFETSGDTLSLSKSIYIRSVFFLVICVYLCSFPPPLPGSLPPFLIASILSECPSAPPLAN